MAIFIKRELTDFDSSVSSLFAFIVHSLLSCDPTFFDQTNENRGSLHHGTHTGPAVPRRAEDNAGATKIFSHPMQ